MRKNVGKLVPKSNLQSQHLFANDPSSNFYLLLNTKLFALRKQFVESSQYLDEIISKNHGVHVLSDNFEEKFMDRVLRFYYGYPCQFDRIEEVKQIVLIIIRMKCEVLWSSFMQDVWVNFTEYQIFTLLEIAHLNKIQQLQQKCCRQLEIHQFEQLNFCRVNLLKTCKRTFTYVIQLHERYKSSRKIMGIKFQNLRKIVEEYNSFNGDFIDVLDFVGSFSGATILQDSGEDGESSENQSLPKIRRCATIFEEKSLRGSEGREKDKRYSPLKLLCKIKEEFSTDKDKKLDNDILLSQQITKKNSQDQIQETDKITRRNSKSQKLDIVVCCQDDIQQDNDRTTSPKSEEIENSRQFQKLVIRQSSILPKGLTGSLGKGSMDDQIYPSTVTKSKDISKNGVKLIKSQIYNHKVIDQIPCLKKQEDF